MSKGQEESILFHYWGYSRFWLAHALTRGGQKEIHSSGCHSLRQPNVEPEGFLPGTFVREMGCPLPGRAILIFELTFIIARVSQHPPLPTLG